MMKLILVALCLVAASAAPAASSASSATSGSESASGSGSSSAPTEVREGAPEASCHTCCDRAAKGFGSALSGTPPNDEAGCAIRAGTSPAQKDSCTAFAVRQGHNYENSWCAKACQYVRMRGNRGWGARERRVVKVGKGGEGRGKVGGRWEEDRTGESGECEIPFLCLCSISRWLHCDGLRGKGMVRGRGYTRSQLRQDGSSARRSLLVRPDIIVCRFSSKPYPGCGRAVLGWWGLNIVHFSRARPAIAKLDRALRLPCPRPRPEHAR